MHCGEALITFIIARGESRDRKNKTQNIQFNLNIFKFSAYAEFIDRRLVLVIYCRMHWSMHTFGYYFLVSLILIRIILLISFDSF